MEKKTSPANKLVLKQILAQEGNNKCADCKTTSYPRWASWNIGILICIRCSGIHRSLGTHISKVRSIDLDTWNDQQLEKLKTTGNLAANAYWEARLPPNYVPDESKLVNFIKTKYELERWVAEPEKPAIPPKVRSKPSDSAAFKAPNSLSSSASASASSSSSSLYQNNNAGRAARALNTANTHEKVGLNNSQHLRSPNPGQTQSALYAPASTKRSDFLATSKTPTSNLNVNSAAPQPAHTSASFDLLGLKTPQQSSTQQQSSSQQQLASQLSTPPAPPAPRPAVPGSAQADVKSSILSLYAKPSPAQRPMGSAPYTGAQPQRTQLYSPTPSTSSLASSINSSASLASLSALHQVPPEPINTQPEEEDNFSSVWN